MNPGEIKEGVDVGDFCFVTTNRLKKHGFVKNDVVYIAGHKFVRDTPRDPYSFRKVFIIAKTNEDHVDISGGFLVDGKSMVKVHKDEHDRLINIYKEDFDAPTS